MTNSMPKHWNIGPALLLACLAAPAAAPAQTDDAAAERARLANQRIQAEVERRRQAEEAQSEAAAAQAPVGEPAADSREARPAEPPPAVPTAAAAAHAKERASVDISKALEQLRALGELRDAGYVTDDEFVRIKDRILDSQF